MSYQSEAKLEKKLVEQLEANGYQKVVITDEQDLINNFREQLFQCNRSKLNDSPFTDKEFERILMHVEGKSVFESAKILRDKFVLEREDGNEVYIEFFNSKEWNHNIFQVTTQVTMVSKYVNRYDVTLLVNGLPVIQIELKRRGLGLKEAFNQIERYRKHSYKGLYRYVQIFIISNGVDTKYFANTDKELMYSYTFFWTDKENNRISGLSKFAASFLDKNHMAKVLARYMVINETDKVLMVMRPYQIYAVEAMIDRALETNNNGYTWHTTGSGKTLTSFKASQILAMEPHIKKVFFLIDRKDLDSQTIAEFNKFEKDCVDMTDNTGKLVEQIQDISKPLIVTTIQKMAHALKTERYAAILEGYRSEKVVFVIDECHRSQFGKMHTSINKHFTNAQYFGFTGTPRFKENKSSDGRVTADLFEKCLHHYLIKDAIKDDNVLGFSVEYVKTFDGQFDERDDTRVKAIDTEEVIMDPQRISLVANHIINNHDAKTRSRQYTAIFTVESIPMLVKYYDEFKKINHNLKIAGIFSYGANEDCEGRDEHSRDSLERMIQDYNLMFDCNYSTDTFSSYFADVSKKVKNAQIDILLVVRMFLTGFDSKTLNTLYVDKNLKYHDLLQAYSRTNRVEKATKPYGNIVCYRNLKHETDEAIRLFSQTQDTDVVLMENYDYYLAAFKRELEKLYKLAKTPENVDDLESEDQQKAFVVCFRELTKALVKLETFTQFEFKEDQLGIDEQTYQDYKSKYLLIHDRVQGDGGKESILADIDFGIELMHTDKINVAYILNLIKDIDFENSEQKKKDIDNIVKELDRADSEELRLKVDLIKSFLHKVVPTLSGDSCVDNEFNKYEEEARHEEIQTFSESVDVEIEKIQKHIEEFEFSGILNHEQISNEVSGPLLKKRKLIQKIKDFIVSNVKKYK